MISSIGCSTCTLAGDPSRHFPVSILPGQGTTYSNGTRILRRWDVRASHPILTSTFRRASWGLPSCLEARPWSRRAFGTGSNFVGSSELVAITTLHELGHNGKLWHGGAAPIWNPTTRLTYVEPNCKPNHLSIMSYTFSMRGLRDRTGELHFDYSRDVYNDIDDTMLGDGQIGPTPLRFQTAWFAPLVPGLGMEEVKRYCTGAKFPQTASGRWDRWSGRVPQRRLRGGLSHDSTVCDSDRFRDPARDERIGNDVHRDQGRAEHNPRPAFQRRCGDVHSSDGPPGRTAADKSAFTGANRLERRRRHLGFGVCSGCEPRWPPKRDVSNARNTVASRLQRLAQPSPESNGRREKCASGSPRRTTTISPTTTNFTNDDTIHQRRSLHQRRPIHQRRSIHQ